MPLNRKIVAAGENDIFGLGVLNVNEGPTSFSVTITLAQLVKKDKSTVLAANLAYDPTSWFLFENFFTLDFRQRERIPIRVDVPEGVEPGTYIYNVEVMANAARYGLTKMYVVVP
jgi:hypothetical protein